MVPFVIFLEVDIKKALQMTNLGGVEFHVYFWVKLSVYLGAIERTTEKSGGNHDPTK